jgi:hypothetical protein
MFIPGSLSETLSSLRECLNSNQSWNFVQAQFFHKFRFMPRRAHSICVAEFEELRPHCGGICQGGTVDGAR